MIEVLEALGVEVVSDDGKEIKGLCPVHELVVGRKDEHPSWYMNRVTGAWICFSCHAKGSIQSLVQTLGGDESLIEHAPIDAMKAKIERWRQDVEEEPEPEIIVSERVFNRNPYPGPRARASRDLDKETCELLNIRWSKEGKFFMLPVYSFKSELIGWQEKGRGYFNNKPKHVKKSNSLFAYPAITGGIVVLVESPLDAARFHRYGIQAVAVYGSYTSAAQLEALSRIASQVVLAFDNDKAGHDGAAVAARMLTNLGVPTRFFQYDVGTEGSDPGDLTVDELVDGVENSSVFAPIAIREAAERARKQPWRPKKEEDPMQRMREWAATAKRKST